MKLLLLLGLFTSPFIPSKSQAFGSETTSAISVAALSPKSLAMPVAKPNRWCVRAHYFITYGGSSYEIIGDWHCLSYTTIRSRMANGQIVELVITKIEANKDNQTVTLTFAESLAKGAVLMLDGDGYITPESGYYRPEEKITKVVTLSGDYEINGNQAVVKAAIQ